MTVYGLGRRKTPEAFVPACDRFIYLDLLQGARRSRRSGEPDERTGRARPEADPVDGDQQHVQGRRLVEPRRGRLLPDQEPRGVRPSRLRPLQAQRAGPRAALRRREGRARADRAERCGCGSTARALADLPPIYRASTGLAEGGAMRATLRPRPRPLALTALALLAPAIARADTVTDWNAYASTAIVANRRAAAARCGAELRDGARRRLRRGQRDRSRPSPLPHRAAGRPLGLKGRRGGDSGVPRPRRALPDPAADPPTALRDSLAAVDDTPPGAKAAGVAIGDAAAAAMLAARATTAASARSLP